MKLHKLTAYDLPYLTRWNPHAKVEGRIAALERVIPKDHLSQLEQLRTNALSRLSSASSSLEVGVIHGDAYYGNVIVTKDGPQLIDLDELAVGPREVDLAPTLVGRRRIGVSAQQWSQFCQTYGFDLHSSALAGPLTELRELTMTSWLMQQWGQSHAVDHEIDLRLSTIDEESHWTRWHAF